MSSAPDYQTISSIKGEQTSKPKTPSKLMLSSSIWSSKGKVAIFLFIVYMILNSHSFIIQVIGRMGNTLDMNQYTNNKGTIIQGILLVICYIIVDICVEQNWI
jgi:hypothetical protein